MLALTLCQRTRVVRSKTRQETHEIKEAIIVAPDGTLAVNQKSKTLIESWKDGLCLPGCLLRRV